MIKFGCMALVAMACSTAMPAAHAGNFFVAGHVGQAEYDDTGFQDDSASTLALSGGYRWQAGPVAQVGIEVGFGTVDEISSDHDYFDGRYTQTNHLGMKTDYRHLGANARINFGRGSRWFALVRGGYATYGLDARSHFEVRSSDGLLIYRQDRSGSDNGDGAYFGGGVGVDLTPRVNLNLMLNGYAYAFGESYYSSDEVGTASTTTLGLEARF